LEEVENWKVDTANPNKILTVSGEDLSCELIQQKLEQAGFMIEQV